MGRREEGGGRRRGKVAKLTEDRRPSLGILDLAYWTLYVSMTYLCDMAPHAIRGFWLMTGWQSHDGFSDICICMCIVIVIMEVRARQ